GASALCALAAPTPTAASVKKRTNRRFCLIAAPLSGRHSFANAACPYEFRRFHICVCVKVNPANMLLDSTLDRARKSGAAAVSCDLRGHATSERCEWIAPGDARDCNGHGGAVPHEPGSDPARRRPLAGARELTVGVDRQS